jgi:adenylate cyclase
MKRELEGSFADIVAAAVTPFRRATSMFGILVTLWGASLFLSIFAEGISATLVSTIETAVFMAASMTSSVVSGRRKALMRQRLEQHLAPVVVRRILQTPAEFKLIGERREITALFTDIEGFTAMTHRVDAAALMAALDNYLEGIAIIIAAHDGMIDKIVGDAVHAFFNATIDLEDHPNKAIECAIALRSWAEVFRHCPEAAAIGFGRTRIGIETGPAIIGDVGIRAKLDYTAHGDAVNVAARLEHANKELGSSICIGPEAASRCLQSLLRPLGKISVDGYDHVLPVFEPWPRDTPKSWRESYLAAISLYDQDPVDAADRFDQLAAEQIDDWVPRRIASQMRASRWR